MTSTAILEAIQRLTLEGKDDQVREVRMWLNGNKPDYDYEEDDLTLPYIERCHGTIKELVADDNPAVIYAKIYECESVLGALRQRLETAGPGCDTWPHHNRAA